jgi:hypothetical protein
MAKKALISTVEPRESGYRVAQVEDAANIFEVGTGLMWVDCADNVVADEFWYDPSDELIKANPVVVEAAPEVIAPTKEELLAQLQALQAQITAL